MRKAILEKFIFVLLAALCINSVIFYIASRNTILDTTKKTCFTPWRYWIRLWIMRETGRSGAADGEFYSGKSQPSDFDPYRWNGGF